MSAGEAMSFAIDTEIPPTFFKDLLKFIQRQYILPRRKNFTNVKRTTVEDEDRLSFRILEPRADGYIDVEMNTGKKIQTNITPSNERIPKAILNQLKDDLTFVIRLFEEHVRKVTLYFAWAEGKEIIPEKAPRRRHNIIYRLFSESMLLFFVIFIVVSILFFIFFGLLAPILLVAIQFIMVLFSDRIIMKTGEWQITKENPNIHLLEYHLPIDEHRSFQQRLSDEILVKLKSEIYEKTFAIGKPLDLETCGNVLSSYGLKCRPENMSTKIVNVYEIVRKIADKFKLPIPKITIANTMVPNAAASGLSPNRGVVAITTGLLVQLEDNEIESVVGHEFSHLTRRDPLALFGLTATEFLLRVYIIWPLILLTGDYSLYLAYFYLFIAFTGVYFIAKFFEARADLDSAIRIGQPKVLAEALRKIGYRRLQFERIPSYRLQEWIGWDPHPPIYFRVARLENLEAPEKIEHPLVQSIKDNVKGFLDAFGLNK